MISPDRETAAQWAREELAKPPYARERRTLLQRAMDWLAEQLDRLANAVGAGPGQLLAFLVVVAVVAVVVVVLVRRNVRAGGTARSTPGSVLGDSALSGAEHRRRAAAAMADGRYDEAVRESMRAIARRLDERALVDQRPGRTADEIAAAAGSVLPELAEALGAGARTFDDVAYGSVRADRGRAEQLARLDLAVESARPARLGSLVGPA